MNPASPRWGDRHGEPVHYAQLLRVAAQAIPRADAGAVIIRRRWRHRPRPHGHGRVRFLQRMLAAGTRESLDAVAVQPFGFGATPGDTRRRTDVLNAQRAALLRRTLTAAGAADLPVIAASGWNDRPSLPVAPCWSRSVRHLPRSFLNWRAPGVAVVGRRAGPWIDRTPPDDPAWGFAADAALLGAA
ncbi:MAG: hypothetical protein R2838_19525 [Caldilineaceae bacterium]